MLYLPYQNAYIDRLRLRCLADLLDHFKSQSIEGELLCPQERMAPHLCLVLLKVLCPGRPLQYRQLRYVGTLGQDHSHHEGRVHSQVFHYARDVAPIAPDNILRFFAYVMFLGFLRVGILSVKKYLVQPL